jgi:type VI secretion system secreted protein Hcp
MRRSFYVLLAVIVIGLYSYTPVNSAVMYPTTSSGSNIFVLFEGIAGGSMDDRHKDWVDATSVSNQLTGAPLTLDGRTSGRVNFEEFTVVKSIDKASPTLVKLCATGQLLRKVVIELVRPGVPTPYMSYILEGVRIASVNSDASSIDGVTVSTETVTLAFSKITTIYTDVDPTGRTRGTVTSGYDITQGKAF